MAFIPGGPGVIRQFDIEGTARPSACRARCASSIRAAPEAIREQATRDLAIAEAAHEATRADPRYIRLFHKACYTSESAR